MIFRELSNAAFRFSLRRPGAEIMGGRSNAPPPAGGGKSRGPAGRGPGGGGNLLFPSGRDDPGQSDELAYHAAEWRPESQGGMLNEPAYLLDTSAVTWSCVFLQKS